MKEEITALAIQLHIFFMERKEYDYPEFDAIFEKASEYHEIESAKDLHFVAYAIEQLSSWDQWTDEWLREEREAKSQAQWEDANRGEI